MGSGFGCTCDLHPIFYGSLTGSVAQNSSRLGFLVLKKGYLVACNARSPSDRCAFAKKPWTAASPTRNPMDIECQTGVTWPCSGRSTYFISASGLSPSGLFVSPCRYRHEGLLAQHVVFKRAHGGVHDPSFLTYRPRLIFPPSWVVLW